MAFPEATHASLVAILLRAPALNHQSEAARILAVDKLATLVDWGLAPPRNADTQFLFDGAMLRPESLTVALDVACGSVDGPGLAEKFWGARSLGYGGAVGVTFEPPASATETATAEEVWQARVSALPSQASTLISAASGSFELASTRDDLITLYTLAQNQASDPAAYLAAHADLFGE